jgi:hypothetical protein
MDERKFVEALERASAWVVRYLERTRDFPVLSRVRPGEVAAAMAPAMPEEGEDFDALLDDFERVCGELLIFDTNQQFATHRIVRFRGAD